MATITRRMVLLAGAGAVTRPAFAATLMPDAPGKLTLTSAAGGLVALRSDNVAGEVLLPAGRARLVAVLPIAGRDIVAVGFADDPTGGGGDLELVAFVGWDGSWLRVLALDVLGWQGMDGSLLWSRMAATSDRMKLRIERDTAGPRAGRTRAWEHWTDYFVWQEGGALADAPVRPALPETWQARLAQRRKRAAVLLSAPMTAVTPATIADIGFSGLFVSSF